jgi:exodeoxyribonuclease-5/deoxyribonuclease V
MILAFDTYYFDNSAKTVCLAFGGWMDENILLNLSETIDEIEDYVPGEFYKRELPCILSLLKKVDLTKVEVIIIDGFVFLDDNNKLGLGGHLYEGLGAVIPVIGVAKTNFATIEENKRAVFRGDSKNPLFVTAVGMNVDDAAEKIKNMSGTYRMPTLLKQLDRLTKENIK